MAIATLSAVIQEYITRKNYINLEITNYMDQKNLAARAQSDTQSLLSARKRECSDYWKEVYKSNESYQDKYKDYTEIPDYEDEIARITAELQDEIDRLIAWETEIDAKTTTASTELKEIEAYLKSYEEMLSGNITDDFNYASNS